MKLTTAKPGRKCAICGKTLSIYNLSDVCFHHPEHPKYKYSGVPHNHFCETMCTSHTNIGRIDADNNYYGRCDLALDNS